MNYSSQTPVWAYFSQLGNGIKILPGLLPFEPQCNQDISDYFKRQACYEPEHNREQDITVSEELALSGDKKEKQTQRQATAM